LSVNGLLFLLDKFGLAGSAIQPTGLFQPIGTCTNLFDSEFFISLYSDFSCFLKRLLLDESHLWSKALQWLGADLLTSGRWVHKAYHLVHLAKNFVIVKRSR